MNTTPNDPATNIADFDGTTTDGVENFGGCAELCNQNNTCEYIVYDGTASPPTCKEYTQGNVPAEYVFSPLSDTQNYSDQKGILVGDSSPAVPLDTLFYKKDYPYFDTMNIEGENYKNTGRSLSGLDMLAKRLNDNINAELYASYPITIDNYIENKPYNFYTLEMSSNQPIEAVYLDSAINTEARQQSSVRSSYYYNLAKQYLVDTTTTADIRTVISSLGDRPYINTGDKYILTSHTDLNTNNGQFGERNDAGSGNRTDFFSQADFTFSRNISYLYLGNPQTLLTTTAVHSYERFDLQVLPDSVPAHSSTDTDARSIRYTPEIGYIYYIDYTKKPTPDPLTFDEYGLKTTITEDATNDLYKYIRYIDSRRLSKDPNFSDEDDTCPGGGCIYPLLNNTLAYYDGPEHEIDAAVVDSGPKIINFLSDAVKPLAEGDHFSLNNPVLPQETTPTGGNPVPPGGGTTPTAAATTTGDTKSIMNERFIYLKHVDDPTSQEVLEPPNISYIKNRSVFDILLNYSPLSELPPLPGLGYPSNMDPPEAIILGAIYSKLRQIGGSAEPSDSGPYKDALGIYLGNYLLLKHMLDDSGYGEGIRSPYWSSGEPRLSAPVTAPPLFDVLQYEGLLGDRVPGPGNNLPADAIEFFLEDKSNAYIGKIFGKDDTDTTLPIFIYQSFPDAIDDTHYDPTKRTDVATTKRWDFVSYFVTYYGFLDFLIGTRASELLDEIIVKKLVRAIGDGANDIKPFVSSRATNVGIQYYLDQLIDYTYELLSECLDACVYIGDTNRMGQSTPITPECMKRGDNVTGCDRHFYQIIPYRKEKLYTNRSFIEIMKEDTIYKENGILLSIFLNDYKRDILKDFKSLDAMKKYTPLHYPIPETPGDISFTIPFGNKLIVELTVDWGGGYHWVVQGPLQHRRQPPIETFTTFYLYIDLLDMGIVQGGSAEISGRELYSRLVDLFRSDSINNYVEDYKDVLVQSDPSERGVGGFFGAYLDACQDSTDSLIDILRGATHIDGNGSVTLVREDPYAQWSLGDYYPYLKDGNLSLGAEQVSPDAVEGRWELYQMIDPGDTVGLGHEHMSLTPGDPSVSIILHTIDPPDTGAPSNAQIYDMNLKNYTLFNSSARINNPTLGGGALQDITQPEGTTRRYIVGLPYPYTADGNDTTDYLVRVLDLKPINPPNEQSTFSMDNYYTKTSILNKMVEICNKPSDPHPTPNSTKTYTDPSKNTGLLQQFFNNSDFKTDMGKYFSNISKNDIECVKLGDIYSDEDPTNDADPTNNINKLYNYCKIVDPQCNSSDGTCGFYSVRESLIDSSSGQDSLSNTSITFRGDPNNSSEQNKYYLFTNLGDISNKVTNLVYNIYDYILDSSYSDVGLDSTLGGGLGTLDTSLENFCEESCQLITPNPASENYMDANETDLQGVTKNFNFTPDATDHNNNKYSNNDDLTYIDYTTDASDEGNVINEYNLNNYKNYDVSKNIFTNIYSYNASNCKGIETCDVDNIGVLDFNGRSDMDTFDSSTYTSELEPLEKVYPNDDNVTNEYKYKCSRYCTINETCKSTPDVEHTRYSNENDLNDPFKYNNTGGDTDKKARNNSKFNNIFSQTNMAIIKKGRCPPFTTSNTNGECVYYDPDKPNKAYDYNGEDISLLTTPAPFGGPPLAVYISNSCTTTPNTFQDNMDLYHACEEWYLQSVGDPENPHRRRQRRRRRRHQNNIDKCISDISQGGNVVSGKKYDMPDLNLEKDSDNDNDAILRNRNKINERFSDVGRIESCMLPSDEEKEELIGQTCANFVTDYIVKENYFMVDEEDTNLKNLNEYHIGPRSYNGEYVKNNPIHNSIIGINPPSPLEPELGDTYVNKDFFGKYEYAKYVDPKHVFSPEVETGSPSGPPSDPPIKDYLGRLYQDGTERGEIGELYYNINKYVETDVSGSECGPNEWPFKGYSPVVDDGGGDAGGGDGGDAGDAGG